MNETIQLKNSNLPKMLGELMHSNQFLKFFAIVTLFMAALSMIVVLTVVSKPPTVLTLLSDGSAVDKTSLPKPEDQIDKAVRRYLDLRYRWEPKSVQAKIKQSESFILPNAVKAFEASTAPIVKFSTEKLVSQKIYADHVFVNLENKSASITGDRLTDIQGMRATGALKLTLFFENGPMGNLYFKGEGGMNHENALSAPDHSYFFSNRRTCDGRWAGAKDSGTRGPNCDRQNCDGSRDDYPGAR